MQRSNLSKKDCCSKQQRLWLLFVKTRTRKHKKSVACVYTDEHGWKKLKCSCVQMLWVAHLIIALSVDVEENPGPLTQTKSIQFPYWNPDYLNLVEFQSMYWEMETVFSVRYHASPRCKVFHYPQKTISDVLKITTFSHRACL